LIIVMVSIIVLAVLAGGFAYSMKVETKLARNANCETELEWLGRSGVELARWVLAEQLKITAEPYDALNQKWAGGSGGINISNSPLSKINVNAPVELGNGRFTITKITDLERKFNINLADQAILERALIAMGVEIGDASGLVGSILDWIDGDSVTHIGGAEKEYYQGFNPPYVAKNGPIDDLSEMLLIKGITPEIYWGAASRDHSLAAFQARAGRLGFQAQPIVITAGLVDIFTPLSSGKININTASAETLQLIPGVDNNIAQAIVGGRTEGYAQGGGWPAAPFMGGPAGGYPADASGLMGPYRNVGEVVRVPEVPRALLGQLGRYCDVRSRTFEVQVTAEISGYTRHFIAVVGRNSPRDVPVLSFYGR